MSVFDGPWDVYYGQLYLESALGRQSEDMQDHFAGQSNGLLGAAVPGALFLLTGLHTGSVLLRVEILETEPPDDEDWEEVVEASLTVQPPAALVAWGAETTHPLPLPAGDYRVRWSGSGLDAVDEADTILDGEDPIDRYLLELWPAPPAPDRIIRQTSDTAAYWHRWARGES